jgi:hypothetical protein
VSRLRASEVLEEKFWLFSGPVLAARARLWGHPRIAELFPEILYRMHCQARATIGLMSAAARQLSLDSHDPLRAALRSYLEAHIPEETGHDEWLVESLEALGVGRSEVLTRMPPPSIAAMVGAQYYWIFHHHPLALLGYIKVVESEPSTVAEVNAVAKRLGLPKEAFAFHLRHARLEPRHNRELNLLLDSLPLAEEHTSLIGVSLQRTLHFRAASLDDIVLSFDAEAGRRAGPGAPRSMARTRKSKIRNPLRKEPENGAEREGQ